MGAYAPLPWAPPGLVDEVLKTVVEPTIDEMRSIGIPFSGLLYVGLAVTARGPQVVEFNCRFGDPETEVVLPLLRTPLAGLLTAAATGRLAEHPPLSWSDGAAVTVVVASEGYPASPKTGDDITGIDAAEQLAGVAVLHAGTARADDGRLLTAGGRVLAVTAVGADLAGARQSAYDAVGRISIRGSHHRRDIAERAAHGDISPPS
jgi:phosphoribosylamine--glycine ligase